MSDLRLDRAAGRLCRGGETLDLSTRRWRPGEGGGVPVSRVEAARWLQRESGQPCRVPLAVVGPREPTPEQLGVAEAVGAAFGRLGATLLTGGRGGVMEAACRGAAQAGGLTVGLLPDDTWETANPWVAVPLASGIGVARNAIIARAALGLFAVGGGYGTISEMAFGLQFGRPVFALAGAPAIAGARILADAAAAESAAADLLLGLST